MSTTTIGSTGAGAGATGGASGAAPTKTLGQDSFLKLLMAQISNQDPLQPVDNQAFIAQLAQFSSVEQLTGLGTRLDSLLLATASANQMNTASLVGKEAAFRTDSVELAAGGPARFQARLDGDAELTAVVQDAAGRTVRTLPLGHHAGGAVDVEWDGRDEAGRALPAGSYHVVLAAKDGAGQDVGVEMRARGLVRGVRFEDGATVLLVGASLVRLSDVTEITQA